MSIEQHQFQQHAKDHSIHYNPYRHKGAAKQYRDWEDGWKSTQAENHKCESMLNEAVMQTQTLFISAGQSARNTTILTRTETWHVR